MGTSTVVVEEDALIGAVVDTVGAGAVTNVVVDTTGADAGGDSAGVSSASNEYGGGGGSSPSVVGWVLTHSS